MTSINFFANKIKCLDNKMNFIAAAKTCFKKYGDYSGRASRSELFLFYFFCYIVIKVLSFNLYFPDFFEILQASFALLIIPAHCAVTVRRLHDVNKSGWWYPFLIISVIGIPYLVYLLFKKGDGQPNRFDQPISIKKRVVFSASSIACFVFAAFWYSVFGKVISDMKKESLELQQTNATTVDPKSA